MLDREELDLCLIALDDWIECYDMYGDDTYTDEDRARMAATRDTIANMLLGTQD